MQDNINRVVKFVTEAEVAAALKDIGPFIRITKKLKGDFRTYLSRALKRREGTINSDVTKQRARWQNHVERILKRPSPSALSVITRVEDDWMFG